MFSNENCLAYNTMKVTGFNKNLRLHHFRAKSYLEDTAKQQQNTLISESGPNRFPKSSFI